MRDNFLPPDSLAIMPSLHERRMRLPEGGVTMLLELEEVEGDSAERDSVRAKVEAARVAVEMKPRRENTE